MTITMANFSTKLNLNLTMEQTENRIPRALGVTALLKQYHISREEEDRDKVLRYIMQQYIMDGLHYQGFALNLQQLSHYLQVPLPDVYRYMDEGTRSISGLVQSENLGRTLETLASVSIQGGLKNYGIAQKQVQLLVDSQGDSYKPFISSEVTKAIKVLMESTKALGDTYNNFFKDTAPKIQIFQPKVEEDEEGLTTTDAIKLLETEGHQKPLKEDDIKLKNLYLEYSIEEDTPEVNYNKQSLEDDKNTFMSLKATPVEEDNLSQEITEAVLAEPVKKKNHSNRRQLEEQLDEEQYI